MIKKNRTGTVTLLAGFLCMSFLLSACSPPAGNGEDGQRWFMMNNCFACHGKNANDGRAPKIAGLNRSFGSFNRFIRNPNSARMPSFSEEQISKQDAADIYIWLKNLPE